MTYTILARKYRPQSLSEIAGQEHIITTLSNAIQLNRDRMAYVVVDDKCVGCKMCVLACPFGAMELFPDHGKAEKCDHCLSIDGDPECVKFCVPGALVYTDLEEGVRHKVKATALKLKETYKEVTA